MPDKAEREHPPRHLAEHEARFLAQALWADVAARDDTLEIILMPLRHFAAPGDDERGRRVGDPNREPEGVKRRLRRRIDLRADVAARPRIDPVLAQAPLGDRACINLL